MVGWTIARAGIMPIGIVVVFKWKQRHAGHIAYWQRQWTVEERKGEAASQLPDSLERRPKMDRHLRDEPLSLRPHQTINRIRVRHQELYGPSCSMAVPFSVAIMVLEWVSV